MKGINKETANTIGKWAVVAILVICAAFFANKGNMDAAGGFGLGAGAVVYLSFLRDNL